MTDQQLYRIPISPTASADAFRTLLLILATVVIAIVVVAAVPDAKWAEMSAQQSADMPDWHGNVASQ